MDSNSAGSTEHVHFSMAAKRSLALSQVNVDLENGVGWRAIGPQDAPALRGVETFPLNFSVHRRFAVSAFRQSTLQSAVSAKWIEPNNGPTMMARIGMLRALNRHVERVFDPSRKRLMQIKTMKQMYGRLEPKLINLSVTKNPPAPRAGRD